MKPIIPFVLGAALLAMPLPAAEAKSSTAPTTKTLKQVGRDVWEDTKAAGRAIRDSEAGQATKETGKEIGKGAAEAGKEVGKETADFSKDLWKKVSKASVQAAKEVRDVTVNFWNGRIAGKEKERDRLEKENAKLKKDSK